MLCAPKRWWGETIVAGHIVLARAWDWSLWSPRFSVRIDGERVGKIQRDSSEGFEVAAGLHRIRMSQLGYSSKTLVVSVADGETLVLRTGLRTWINPLLGLSGWLIGASGYPLFAHGPTPINVAGFTIGVALTVAVFASKVLISLRPQRIR